MNKINVKHDYWTDYQKSNDVNLVIGSKIEIVAFKVTVPNPQWHAVGGDF